MVTRAARPNADLTLKGARYRGPGMRLATMRWPGEERSGGTHDHDEDQWTGDRRPAGRHAVPHPVAVARLPPLVQLLAPLRPVEHAPRAAPGEQRRPREG